jgi:hypothetical protein
MHELGFKLKEEKFGGPSEGCGPQVEKHCFRKSKDI